MVKVCSHGYVTKYCHDDATPIERENYDYLYGHAYRWAHDWQGMTRDDAEAYAAEYAGRFYADNAEEWPEHFRYVTS